MRVFASLAAFGLLGAASGHLARRDNETSTEFSGYIIEYAKVCSGTSKLSSERRKES